MPAYKDVITEKWYCQFYYKDWTGKRKHKVKRGFNRKKDAEEWERKFKNTEQTKDVTIDTLIENYLKHIDLNVKLGNIKEQTAIQKKRWLMRSVMPFFKGVYAKKIKAKDINEWLVKINHHYLHKRSLSSNYINLIKGEFKRLFDYGIKNFDLQENPIKMSEKVKTYSPDIRAKFWTLEQYSFFYSCLKNNQQRLIFNLMFFAGLRIGEVVALTDDCVSSYKIEVRETFVKIPGKKFYGKPKTKTSERVVAIPAELYFQFKDFTSGIYGLRPTDKVFSISPTSIRYTLDTLAKKLDLPKISPHILRHSYASLLFSKTKNILIVANQIGHKNPSMTYDIYSHALPNEEKKVAELLNTAMLTIDKNDFLNSK